MPTHSISEVAVDPAAQGQGARVGRWSLMMAYWAMFSAMFWLYVAVASASAVGPGNTIIGMVLSVISYGVINAILSRHAIRTGETISAFSRNIFGPIGSSLAALLFAVTAIYYATFEGSIIAVALHQYFGGPLKVWYLVVVLYALPLVARGVQNWLDKLNGALLPLYLAGLFAAVVGATVKQGYPTGWLIASPATSDSSLPGWIISYLIYMGVWVMMMYTFEFARLGRQEDSDFHATVTFGWVFYAATFALNGLVGIYVVTAWHFDSTETGVISALIQSLGIFGLLLIIVSQTRINTANYYAASTNLQQLFHDITGRTSSRLLWVVISGVLAYIFMLTNVLSYLLQALAWQGVFVTAWVAVAVTALYLDSRVKDTTLDVQTRSGQTGTRAISWPVMVWIIAAGVGIALTEQSEFPTIATLSPAVTVVIAVAAYSLGRKDRRASTGRAEVLRSLREL